MPIHIIDETQRIEFTSTLALILLFDVILFREMKALIIKTPKGNVLHQLAIGNLTQIRWLARCSAKGTITTNMAEKGEIWRWFADSTNVLSAGHSRSEGEL